jgi:hypothetical protein
MAQRIEAAKARYAPPGAAPAPSPAASPPPRHLTMTDRIALAKARFSTGPGIPDAAPSKSAAVQAFVRRRAGLPANAALRDQSSIIRSQAKGDQSEVLPEGQIRQQLGIINDADSLEVNLAGAGSLVRPLLERGRRWLIREWHRNFGPSREELVEQLSRREQRIIRGLQRQLDEHRRKLEEYIRDPYAYDNRGHLERNHPRLHRRIIRTRIRNLERQIENYQSQIDAIIYGE